MLELVVLLAKVTRGLLLLPFVCLGYDCDVLATSLVTSGGSVKVFLGGPVLLRVIYGLIKLLEGGQTVLCVRINHLFQTIALIKLLNKAMQLRVGLALSDSLLEVIFVVVQLRNSFDLNATSSTGRLLARLHIALARRFTRLSQLVLSKYWFASRVDFLTNLFYALGSPLLNKILQILFSNLV